MLITNIKARSYHERLQAWIIAVRFLRFLVIFGLSLLMTATFSIQGADAKRKTDRRVMQAFKRVYQQYNAGRYSKALPMAQNAAQLARRRLGNAHPHTAAIVGLVGTLHDLLGNHKKAVAFHTEAATITIRVHGRKHPSVASAIDDLAIALTALAKYSQAEKLLLRGLKIRENSLGVNHGAVGNSLVNLGYLYEKQGRYRDAESVLRRALPIMETVHGPHHNNVGRLLTNLANVFMKVDKQQEAEAIYRRSLDIIRRSKGNNHPSLLAPAEGLASAKAAQNKHQEALNQYMWVLGQKKRHYGPGNPILQTTLNNIGVLYNRLSRWVEAEKWFQESLEILEKNFGSEDPRLAPVLSNLAKSYRNQRRFDEAANKLDRAVAIARRNFGGKHREVAHYLRSIGLVRRGGNQPSKAFEAFNSAADIVARNRALLASGDQPSGRHLIGDAVHFLDVIDAAWNFAHVQPERAPFLRSVAFESSQRANQTTATSALKQMSARFGAGTDSLAQLVREHQDLSKAWTAADAKLLRAIAALKGSRDGRLIQTLRSDIAAMEKRLRALTLQLDNEFPKYRELRSPALLTVTDAQRLLKSDEALISIRPLLDSTIVWLVTPTEFRWHRIPVGFIQMLRSVDALRCGLDANAWLDGKRTRCPELIGGSFTTADAASGRSLPFDYGRSHALYEQLFGPIERLIDKKHLFLIQAAPFESLAFHTLVTKKPTVAPGKDTVDPRSVDWLGLRQPITVLPSVTSLRALRQQTRPSRASQPFIGFGNPLIGGLDGTDRRAWSWQSCSAVKTERVKVAIRSTAQAYTSVFRRGLADLDVVRRQTPLPETAYELCAVAKSLQAGNEAVYLGANATETRIKELSRSGELARARVLHFATHGLLSRETKLVARDLAEPSLLLTPPERATSEDDALLTASEIAGLKLDADWVVLSACNTAAGGENSEALSGLASAFFYSGARALLVSHWAVFSDATVKLITHAFAAMNANPRLGRSEAWRLAMLALVQQGSDQETHPSYWAPFVVVGEGGR